MLVIIPQRRGSCGEPQLPADRRADRAAHMPAFAEGRPPPGRGSVPYRRKGNGRGSLAGEARRRCRREG